MGFFLWLFFFCKINVNIYVTICKLYNSKGAIMATIIKIRRGINGFKYAACDVDGNFIWNLNRLSEASQYWKKEIKTGNVRLVRELSLYPETDHKKRD